MSLAKYMKKIKKIQKTAEFFDRNSAVKEAES